MRRVRFCLLLGLAALLVVAAVSPAHALKPTSAFYVNDYVGVLSLGQAEYLTQRGSQLYQENGVQVVLVIVDNYIGESMAEYAHQVFNEFGIGTKGKNNGVLLIVATDDEEVRIEVGDGLSAQLPDSKAGTILDEHFMPAASDGDIENAVYATYLALIREGSRLDTKPPPSSTTQVNWFGTVLGVLLILAGVTLLLAAANRRRRSYDPPPAYPPPPIGGPNQGQPGSGRSAYGGGVGGPVIIPRIPMGPPQVRFPRPSSQASQQRTWGASPNRRIPPPAPPSRPNQGGGGRSSGGGAERSFGRGGFGSFGGSPSARPSGSRPSSGGSFGGGFRGGGSAPRTGGSGGGGRSSGGGAGRGFKK